MTKIYDQHDKSFPLVSAYAIMKGKKHIANVSIKYPRDGAGRLYAYFHIIGLEMVRGHAGGYGYDKRSAAVVDAICYALPLPELSDELKGEAWAQTLNKKEVKLVKRIKLLFDNIGGKDWGDVFRDEGYTIINVI